MNVCLHNIGDDQWINFVDTANFSTPVRKLIEGAISSKDEFLDISDWKTSKLSMVAQQEICEGVALILLPARIDASLTVIH